MSKPSRYEQFGRWRVGYAAEDGARLTSLSFDDLSLLAGAPRDFRAPTRDYGKYETRPVYGYDDCFPTVDACSYPSPLGRGGWSVPDHGELCWLPWTVKVAQDELHFEVESKALPLRFVRVMRFTASGIEWRFEIKNEGEEALPFMHVMHALLPLENVARVELPAFSEVMDEVRGMVVTFRDVTEVAEALSRMRLEAEMFLLRGVKQGQYVVRFRSGQTLRVTYPAEVFPTLGIWWNHEGHPDEDGLRRMECALEPIAGRWSSLEKSLAEGDVQMAEPGRSTEWTIRWEIET